MSKTIIWIKSFRLRTLPLSLSGVIFASMLAYANDVFSLHTCIYALLTTLFLQILSNLANDLGDSLKGTDNDKRKGPQRAMQTGLISIKEMKMMILFFIVLSIISGTLLIKYSFDSLRSENSIYMLSLGALAIVAAIKYTLGKGAYGYRAMGDIFVYIFFGLASVMGTYFLHSSKIPLDILLPASSIGLLAVGVLNMNNIRDIENDKACNKNTIPVIIGEKKAKYYQYTLIVLSLIFMSLYFVLRDGISLYPFFIVLFPITFHLYKVKILSGKQLDSQLKILALSTFLFAILSGLTAIL